MNIRALNPADLKKLEQTSIAEYLLTSLSELEQYLKECKLNPKELIESNAEKIRINNLLLLMHLFLKKCEFDPIAGKVAVDAHKIIYLLQLLKEHGVAQKSILNIDISIDTLRSDLEKLRSSTLLHLIRPGNVHVSNCYHPDFYDTYSFKPSYLPDDYRSNFFFEVKVKELCPYTTLIGYHPYSDYQSLSQEGRSMAELTKIYVNVDLVDNHAIEIQDNLRAIRMHGPSEHRNIPGSYILVRGGHHRMRSIYQKYLRGEISGDLKILVQKVEISSFPMSEGDFLHWAGEEIRKRDKIRRIH